MMSHLEKRTYHNISSYHNGLLILRYLFPLKLMYASIFKCMLSLLVLSINLSKIYIIHNYV